MKTKSVYIHIPFCKTICSYCDFCKFYYNEKWVDLYLKTLEKEINQNYQNDLIETIYIGGGTPSSLNTKELIILFNIIKIFKLANDYEITIECNLNDINEEFIKLITSNKINRISIGIESFNKDNLKLLNREASYKKAKKIIKLCHKYNLNNINIDLIYAIPNESIKVLKKDLKLVKKLNVPHISTYSLILEKHTMLAYQNIQNIDEDIDFQMYQLITKKLKKYNHYEISNFAKKGYKSKHNLTYWYNEQYYGFGLCASGYIDNVRYTNTRNLSSYIKGNYLLEKEVLSKKDIMNYEIILGMRLLKGININNFNQKYQTDIFKEYNLSTLINNKDLIVKKGNIFINPEKLYIMNEILIKLV